MTDPTILVPPWLASVLHATGHTLPPTMAVDGDDEDEEPRNACRACGREIADDRTHCGALECGGGALPDFGEPPTPEDPDEYADRCDPRGV